jgi:glycosyltransferase involved in cell wall biosynthesis
VSVHGAEPPESDWIRKYRQNVARGIAGADLVVAPTAWMLQQVCRYYGEPKKKAVVYDGRNAALFLPCITRQGYAISVGRLWDAGKQATLLLRDDLPVQVLLVGSEQSPEGAVSSAKSMGRLPKLEMKGPQTEGQLAQLLARASFYIATSRYEPFGLAPLEAALSGCPLLANDIPSLREVWGEDAFYFETNNSQSLLLAIQELASNSTLRSEYASRALERARKQYSSARMADEYLELYRSLISAEVAAA